MRKVVSAGIIAGVLLVALACGDLRIANGHTDVRTRSGPVSFAGTVAYFFRSQGILGPVDAGPDPVNHLNIEIHESSDGCGPRPGVNLAARSIFYISVASPLSEPITTGRYPVAFGPSFDHSFAGYVHQEEFGGILLSALSGELDLLRLSDDSVQGSIDVTLQDGTQIAGDFSAAPCP